MKHKTTLAEQAADQTAREAVAAKAQVARLRGDLRRTQLRVANWAALSEAFVEAAASLPIPTRTPSKAKPKQSEQEMVALLSDTHTTAFWTTAQTDGLTEYNFEMFCQMLWYYGEEIARLAEEFRPLYGLRVLHVDMLGDIYHGILRLDDEVTNEFPSVLGVSNTAWVLWQWLVRLLAHFDAIHVVCMAGNHGRFHDKPQSKRYVGENWDTKIYMDLRAFARIAGITDRLRVTIPGGRRHTFRRLGHRIKAAHGDHIRGGNSIAALPIYGLSRDILRDFGREIRAGRGEKVGLIEMGHWHFSNFLEDILLVNGAVCPTGPWAMDERGAFNDPKQYVYFTSESHVFGWQLPLALKHGIGQPHGFAYDEAITAKGVTYD